MPKNMRKENSLGKKAPFGEEIIIIKKDFDLVKYVPVFDFFKNSTHDQKYQKRKKKTNSHLRQCPVLAPEYDSLSKITIDQVSHHFQFKKF